MLFARPLVVLGLGATVLAAAAAWPGDAFAQQIYRSVTPDGRVTFSDLPAADGSARAASAAAAPAGAGPDSATGALPFELRQAATSYPVTFYTAPDCLPCSQGRAMLVARGIPFAEKTVTTNEDIEALKRLAGAATLPVVGIGGQHLRGYSEQEWTQYLDAAGYPKTSQLPPGFQRPASAPLVAVAPARPPASAPAPATASARPAPPPLPPTTPYNGGFRF